MGWRGFADSTRVGDLITSLGHGWQTRTVLDYGASSRDGRRRARLEGSATKPGTVDLYPNMADSTFDLATARPRAGPGVSAYDLDQEIVLYDGSGGLAYVLNVTGARIWRLCDGQRDGA